MSSKTGKAMSFLSWAKVKIEDLMILTVTGSFVGSGVLIVSVWVGQKGFPPLAVPTLVVVELVMAVLLSAWLVLWLQVSRLGYAYRPQQREVFVYAVALLAALPVLVGALFGFFHWAFWLTPFAHFFLGLVLFFSENSLEEESL